MTKELPPVMSNYEPNASNQKHSIDPSQMPPLDKTAQVPPIHSDTLNDPAYWDHKLKNEPARVPAREHRDQLKWHEKTSVRIGGAVAGLVAVGGAVFGVTSASSDNSVETNNKPSVSASDTMLKEIPTSPEEAVGVAINDSFDFINTQPSRELIDEAKKPVLVSDFPDPEKAMQRLWGIRNVYTLSGAVDLSDWHGELPSETSKSKAEGEQLLTNAFSAEMLDDPQNDFTDERELRQVIAMDYAIFEVDGRKKDRQGNAPTWRNEWRTGSIEQAGEDSYEIEGIQNILTNIDSPDFDPRIRQNIKDFDQKTAPTHVVLSDVDGQWLITEISVE